MFPKIIPDQKGGQKELHISVDSHTGESRCSNVPLFVADGGIASQMGLVGTTPTQKPIDLRDLRGLMTTTAINSQPVDDGEDIRSDHGQALLETEMERLKEDFWLSLGKSGSLPLKPTLRREDIITED